MKGFFFFFKVGVVLCIVSAGLHHRKTLLPVSMMLLIWDSLSTLRNIDSHTLFFCALECIRFRKPLRLLSILGLVWGSLLRRLRSLCIVKAVRHGNPPCSGQFQLVCD